ncbi:TetR/AcrR family transcriptional regulator [Agromyces aerolatus]|uniref:TetR/AcrR family transcriptional regulator n=1 Tax=Agromyces sp. LY-1074 TaxID=3074080 RepID=UPI0028639E50|nr:MULTISPECIES: TetR family transcriptional regulator C-terminal domain-containing protein [unclassified Agromyces]MDR5698593.1 TetR family transcriptional regulator C-terminal domain-containing protein [Agromyces sp. LY-1074]MDR5704887.1 TetR family transcriptional regulator C-terminal domain-containing protein [Agromyces sp. LY-1358]
MSSAEDHESPPERTSPRGRASRKAPAERRAEIAEAARALALDDGLAAVTLRGVAARAGVTPALVAHYRPNMDELVAETFRTIVSAELREIAELHAGIAHAHGTGHGPAGPERSASNRAAASAAVASARTEDLGADRSDHGSATARLGRLVHTLLDGSSDDVTLVWVEAWALGQRNETLAAAVREQMDAWQHVLQQLIEDGAHAREFDVDDPAAVAWQLLGMIDGLNAQALVRWGEGRSVLLTHALEGMLGLERGALAGTAGNGR